jgi:hypothetical protein
MNGTTPLTPLTLVLWLQSGRKLQEECMPTRGWPPLERRVLALDPRAIGVEIVPEPRASPIELRFMLTDPAAALSQLSLGRRRFHYLELTGWKSREDQYAEDCKRARGWSAIRDLAERTHQQDTALFAAGAFPGEPPKSWAASFSVATPYGIHAPPTTDSLKVEHWKTVMAKLTLESIEALKQQQQFLGMYPPGKSLGARDE